MRDRETERETERERERGWRLEGETERGRRERRQRERDREREREGGERGDREGREREGGTDRYLHVFVQGGSAGHVGGWHHDGVARRPQAVLGEGLLLLKTQHLAETHGHRQLVRSIIIIKNKFSIALFPVW